MLNYHSYLLPKPAFIAMKILKRLLVSFVFLLITFVFVGSVNAQQTPPDFPACSNPQGTLKVKYDSGVHGIPGDPNAYSGSDAVYIVDVDRIQQCFCSDVGNGIQTNWWRIGSLTQEEIDTLKNLGWHFIPDGSTWGLNPEPYMAFNSAYGCGGTRTSTSSLGSSGSSGTVLAAAASTQGSILGLAATGDALTPYGLVLLGLTSILLVIHLYKKKTQRVNMRSISKFFILLGLFCFCLAGFLYWRRIIPQRLQFNKAEVLPSDQYDKAADKPVLLTLGELGITLDIYPAAINNGKWETTTKGVSYLTPSAISGETGNTIFYGHNYKNILGNLKKAKPGQIIQIKSSDGIRKKFRIEYVQIVNANQTGILDQTKDSRLTLYTCTGFLDSKRLVVTAIYQEDLGALSSSSQ